MTQKERTKAFAKYARRHGFSVSTVRAVTVLKRAAVQEWYARKQEKKPV